MFNVAIDGVAGCGKSSLSKGLSQKLGFKYFNTGEMYRAITCEYLSQYNNNPTDKDMEKFVSSLMVEVRFKDNKQIVIVNNHDYTPYLRKEIISKTTPLVSSYQILREKVRELQRDFGKKNNCIMEGRDIGSTVLLNADCKFFLTASPEVRAKRRFDQLKNKGENLTYDEILDDIKKRDEVDKTRKHGVLKPSKDAIIIDNSFETLEQTISRCEKIIKDLLQKESK